MSGIPIGARLKAARELAGGLTVPQLATLLSLPGLSAGTLGAIERGDRALRPQEVAPLANALGVPARFLTDEDPFLSSGDDQLDRIEKKLADATSERQRIQGLLERQDAILARIEKATAKNDNSTQRLDDAAQESRRLLRELESAAQSLAAAQPGTGGSDSPPASS